MRALALLAALCAAGCDTDATSTCQGIALGTPVSSLRDLRPGTSCTSNAFRDPAGPVDDSRCCVRGGSACTASCTPPITASQVGPTRGDQLSPTWCCVFVRDGAVIAHAVMFD